MKILRRNSIIYILLLFIACDRINDNQDPYTALVRLHSRTDYNGYVIIEADGTDKYIQFYLGDGPVFFDIPIYSEVKDKYIESAIHPYAKKNENGLWQIDYIQDITLRKIETIFKNHNIDYKIVGMGYIDPTFFNQTDTTGWAYSIKGPIPIDRNYIKSLIDIFFIEIHGLSKNNLNLKIKEDVFQP